MDKEEKKAIERFKANANYCITSKETTQTILNLIEKQQQEIETLETLLQGNLYEMYKYYKGLANSYQANCISKDKIREKIEEYNLALSKNQTKYTLSKMQEIEFAIISMGELLQEGDK